MKRAWILGLCAAVAAGCTTPPPENEARREAQEVFARSFTRGNQDMLARVLTQDEMQALCSRYRNAPPRDVAERIEKSQAATIVYPDDGKLIGDWRQGEKIAQDGFG